jgi:hypothetical protein
MTGMEASKHVRETLEHAGHGRRLKLVAAPAGDPIGVAQ